MPKKSLSFFVTINKLTDELILQEGGLLSLKIPKQWQKPHSSVKNPALWVCHLPTNSLGITYISLYPTELKIKIKNPENEEEENKNQQQKEEEYFTYKGTLEPNGENDKERFYRCRLKLQVKKEIEETKSSDDIGAGGAILLIIFFVVLFAIIAASGGFN